METRMATCSACGETDYIDMMAKVDRAWHCNACWHNVMEVVEDNAVRESVKKQAAKE